jgi:maleamate amidohydrolase
MRVWEEFITARDAEVFAMSGYGAPLQMGTRPAVIVIDVNYAFCGHEKLPITESVKTWRNSCGEEAWEALPYIQQLLTASREQHIPVFYTTGKDLRPDKFDAGSWSYKNSRTHDKKPLDTGIRGNKIMDEIAPLSSEFVIEKLKPSAFHGTPLASHLVQLNVDTLLICGTTTSGCVRASVIDAFSLNYRVAVVEECCFDRFRSSHAINLFDMNAKYADVISTAQSVAYLQQVKKGLYDHQIDFASAKAVVNV